MEEECGAKWRKSNSQDEKEHKRADTFVTLTNIVSNVVSENNIFNVLL